ncbi:MULTISPECIES: hypothetical protein [unclassified Rhizobium]|uniref:hypothetical protein n=1 Tax=unclassified Rhizobium TaxID=2613769 RepID=UPI001ADC20AE|nr:MULTISPECIES: hypothetical protein [unclassified Rhizobium]MBO9099442.1 hypothetical protein [Rhizobium sp. L58/93]QXZ87073.1 hypothetical protein J5287_21025 [Rhizobium sp. K1/93]QXZ92893.1 hypothetical protein J5280_19870 [Rhizobium sp. K15/93]
MTVALPQANLSWLTQLGSLGKQQQQGNGYFPPAPAAAEAIATPTQPGSFLQNMLNRLPANQAATNPLYQPNMRLGG